MPNFEESYLGQLVQIRNLTGKGYKFLVPATRAIICDPEGRILFVRRKDNGKWVMPSGSQELGETIYDCMKREVWEESGLYVAFATAMAIYPRLPKVFTERRRSERKNGRGDHRSALGSGMCNTCLANDRSTNRERSTGHNSDRRNTDHRRGRDRLFPGKRRSKESNR